jgi:hypothetical protein
LVDLFGKKKLEDRVSDLEMSLAELQKANAELLQTLEKRDEKIKKLTSSFQEANVALKAAEQRSALVSSQATAQTMPESEKAKECKPQGVKLVPREFSKLMKRLALIRSPEDDLLTAYIGRSSRSGAMPTALPTASPIELTWLTGPTGLPPEAKSILNTSSEGGLAVLHCPQLFTMALKPPLPFADISNGSSAGSTFQLEPLQEILETPVLIISAHAGDTFLGIALGSKEGFQEQIFVESQVKEKHSKGGWSQKRFERLREEDIKKHIEDVMERLSEMKKKYGSVVKFVVLGGDASLLKQIAPAVGIPAVERRLERHDEKRLDKLRDEVYSFTCYSL